MTFESYIVKKTIQDKTFYWNRWFENWVFEEIFDEDCFLREAVADEVLRKNRFNGEKILKAKVSIRFQER